MEAGSARSAIATGVVGFVDRTHLLVEAGEFQYGRSGKRIHIVPGRPGSRA
jgi:hypothetical protein